MSFSLGKNKLELHKLENSFVKFKHFEKNYCVIFAIF